MAIKIDQPAEDLLKKTVVYQKGRLLHARKENPYRGMKIKSSQEAFCFFKNNWPEDYNLYERSYLMLLKRSNEIIDFIELSHGSKSGTLVDVSKIFLYAICAHASALIFAHNHPSGSLKFSGSDHQINKKIKQAGELFDITLLDSLIITEHTYKSAADEGQL